ncbi:MAG: membrane protein insertion efficiency factor YidD [Bacteriovorax sp.]|nr:membrane protein insertion efficiency factor YidD [Bacteriovorax sp.]
MIKNNGSENQNISGGSLFFYQGFLSPVLNSACRHYPTDSRYARMMFTKCSWLTSIIKTSARYFSEPNGAKLYSIQTIESNRLYYVDLPEECSL